MKSSLAVVGAGHAQCLDGGLPGWGGSSETCAACCQVLQPVRRVPIAWMDHALAPALTGSAFAHEQQLIHAAILAMETAAPLSDFGRVSSLRYRRRFARNSQGDRWQVRAWTSVRARTQS